VLDLVIGTGRAQAIGELAEEEAERVGGVG
jgi:hypothetical protein